MHPRRAQAMLVAAGACLAVIAYGSALASTPRTGANLWSWWFALAAASCLAFAIRPSSRVLFMFSGLLVPLAFASAFVAVILDLAVGKSDDPSLALAGAALWVLVGILAATTWVFVLGPVASYSAQRRERRSR
jgi:hypothetical protein